MKDFLDCLLPVYEQLVLHMRVISRENGGKKTVLTSNDTGGFIYGSDYMVKYKITPNVIYVYCVFHDAFCNSLPQSKSTLIHLARYFYENGMAIVRPEGYTQCRLTEVECIYAIMDHVYRDTLRRMLLWKKQNYYDGYIHITRLNERIKGRKISSCIHRGFCKIPEVRSELTYWKFIMKQRKIILHLPFHCSVTTILEEEEECC